MPSDLDRRFDAMLAAVIGPGGRLVVMAPNLHRAGLSRNGFRRGSPHGVGYLAGHVETMALWLRANAPGAGG